ncbi:MAG: sigma-54-dependent Fis family transcriptional regulator [bacterium]|nr:sigma-54-dependent Fis family transcriptional regulator [bacterium]
MAVKILLVDDDAALRRILQFKLTQHGFEVTPAANGEEALSLLRSNRFELILSDMKMPKVTGIELLEQSKKLQPEIHVILMTAFAAVPQAVQAVKLGAFDYLTKPFEDEQLFTAIDKALKFRRLEDENRQLREQLRIGSANREMVGISSAFRDLTALIEKIAPTDATILISGESGTGKELVARSIHRKSNRAHAPFLAINCASIPRELIESELFGHVKGAFTGAVKDKKGKFELAEGGTLLLDEISELPFELQAKLLRVIQERVLEPVGSEQRIVIDVRLLAASNVDLAERVTAGTFREDLFYRLNVIPLRVPALRERADDIALLVKEFLQRFSPGAALTVDKALMQALLRHPWPGNIRELENLIERMVILRSADTLTLGDLPNDFGKSFLRADATETMTGGESLSFHESEKRLIINALEKFAWNKSRAADYLQIPRHVLIYRMKKYQLSEKRD